MARADETARGVRTAEPCPPWRCCLLTASAPGRPHQREGSETLNDKRFAAGVNLRSGNSQGDVTAVFSTSDVVDSVGDRVLPTAFKNGQQVPMVWAHDWARPVGRGVVKVEPTRAVFEGRFFTETREGRDAYLMVKGMGDLQQWSFGFQTLESRNGAEGERVITSLELFEVSPVLVGANRSTHTLAIKEGRRNSGTDLVRIQSLHDLAGELGASCGGAKRGGSPSRAGHRPDPALLAIRNRLQHADQLARAELHAIFARNEERLAKDRRIVAEGQAALMTAVVTANRTGGHYR